MAASPKPSDENSESSSAPLRPKICRSGGYAVTAPRLLEALPRGAFHRRRGLLRRVLHAIDRRAERTELLRRSLLLPGPTPFRRLLLYTFCRGWRLGRMVRLAHWHGLFLLSTLLVSCLPKLAAWILLRAWLAARCACRWHGPWPPMSDPSAPCAPLAIHRPPRRWFWGGRVTANLTLATRRRVVARDAAASTLGYTDRRTSPARLRCR